MLEEQKRNTFSNEDREMYHRIKELEIERRDFKSVEGRLNASNQKLTDELRDKSREFEEIKKSMKEIEGKLKKVIDEMKRKMKAIEQKGKVEIEELGIKLRESEEKFTVVDGVEKRHEKESEALRSRVNELENERIKFKRSEGVLIWSNMNASSKFEEKKKELEEVKKVLRESESKKNIWGMENTDLLKTKDLVKRKEETIIFLRNQLDEKAT